MLDAPPLFLCRYPDPETGRLPTVLEWFEREWRPLLEAGCSLDFMKRSDGYFHSRLEGTLRRQGRSRDA